MGVFVLVCFTCNFCLKLICAFSYSKRNLPPIDRYICFALALLTHNKHNQYIKSNKMNTLQALTISPLYFYMRSIYTYSYPERESETEEEKETDKIIENACVRACLHACVCAWKKRQDEKLLMFFLITKKYSIVIFGKAYNECNGSKTSSIQAPLWHHCGEN